MVACCTLPSGITATLIVTTRSFASRAPAGTFQQREICSRTMSISLALSWLPSGARGCAEARPVATYFVCGGASGEGGVSSAARFRSRASNCPGLYFLASALASLRATRCGRSGDGFGGAAATAGFGGGGGIGLGSGKGGGNSACFGGSVFGIAGVGGAGFASGGAGAGGVGGASATVGGGAGLGGIGVGGGFSAGGPGTGGSNEACGSGLFGFGWVARVSGPIVTS